MDQESFTHIHFASASVGAGSGPLGRRRRNSLALATAAVLASASSSAAFSPSSATPLSCHANVQQSPYSGNISRRSKAKERCSSQRRRSLHVLGVSFMEDIMTTTSPISRAATATSSARTSPRRLRKSPSNEGRTIEIDVQPDYAFLGLDDFVVDPEHVAPEIDSEILYEGIVTSASQPQLALKNNQQPNTVVTSEQKGSQTPPVMTVSDKQVTKSSQKNKSTTKKTASATSSSTDKKVKKKSKSSTMPGFKKDKALDVQITNLGLRRLPTSNSQTTRKLTRMARSKSAKLKRRQTNSENMYKKSPSVPDSLIDYTHEIHAISRVTPKEEKELGSKTQEAIRIQKLHSDLQTKYGRDPTDDEWCAAAGKMNVVALKEAIDDGMEAKNQLVASNLRMVQRVVNLYIRNGLGSEYDAGDLMQDGTMALIRAAEKFEPERGFRFSTYAMYWIRSAVKRSQTSQSRIVVVPQRIHETHKRISKNQATLYKELGREPTKAELSAACDISVLQLDRCRKAMSQVTFSLDAEVQNTRKPNNGNNRKDTMYDIVEGKVDETEYERTQRLLMKEHLIGALRQYLSPHEVDLLLLRYGLMDERALPRGMSGPLTIAEVSKLVGLKPDKVRRIIINSQKQLRHLMREWEDFEYELA